MSQERPLPTTSYALLGLLSFGQELTGYELKQFSDSTLRFYWVAPAMSQIYTELARLDARGLIESRDDADSGARAVRRYRINAAGLGELREWLSTSEPEFPILKHPVALRLLLGHLVEPSTVRKMLQGYLDGLERQRADLQAVLDSIEGREGFTYPSLVAGWGLDYYDAERRSVEDIADRLPE
ncbi:MAG TPA: PadR family transcriptional regulator [Nocardioidaceae bacterium]|nr:PadR family transcriptional regulator [Nocardioidaceae bacterium]